MFSCFHVRPLQRMSARFTCLQQQTLKISHSGAKIDEMTSVHRLFRKNICKSDGNKQLQSGEGQHTCVETHTPIVFCVNPHASASSTNVSHSALWMLHQCDGCVLTFMEQRQLRSVQTDLARRTRPEQQESGLRPVDAGLGDDTAEDIDSIWHTGVRSCSKYWSPSKKFWLCYSFFVVFIHQFVHERSSLSGSEGAEDDCRHWARGGVHSGQVGSSSPGRHTETNNHSCSHSHLQSYPSTCRSLDCGQGAGEPRENPGRHRTCRLYKERFAPQCCSYWCDTKRFLGDHFIISVKLRKHIFLLPSQSDTSNIIW